ncbi:MAG: sigma-70 family RNA polymerase sigma factor [Gemmatimonadetes bacterium]|uniref:Sigma-70 family RNA polymerase sigma factor n=1 Tax=Candidatus Kutchimonas denitrificans TaxID=3056748 RepID=A0AAE4Z6U5_9BACT|nr:sigma-70 family RNA polymerase sigma factor [Gemmatimonadota bacterium]NIR74678.1 sigma-70 family RNA polymerase sigma factor [Candidatus Kutchimonas denitrificans]NIS01428.1 sigma-70 family RNA polymerase sigma factor [Gemmatimonadota bacterium]NIT67169.1 sigma-70 family RNA polymerase sigma factor [Gemmatimonadota bacterium]NIU52343.1 sigma-70 family RNA polymerase sigma factor [Gemmatimonadota bacterium]
MNDEEIQSLATAFRRGQERAFQTLVESLSRTLIAMAYRYTGDWEWARDLTQDTWVRVYERIERFDPDRSFLAWLMTVHRNLCLSHLRRAWVRLETAPGDEELGAWPTASEPAGPEEELERREFHRQLLIAMDSLSEGQRQIFARVDLEGRDQKDVARELGIKNGTVRAALHFARRRLATVLSGMEETP